MNKYIFLDVDGVLNNHFTKDTISGYTGIDSEKVNALAEIIERTGAELVLCSSWKDHWQKEHKEDQDEFGDYLDKKLEDAGLEIIDKTIDCGYRRGTGIKNWLSENADPNDRWCVLDDECFADYYYNGNFFDHLVSTEYYNPDGGLQNAHVEQAVKILNE